MDRITAMSVFVRVVEAGSFTKAAESLDLPPPKVTRLVQALEAELRVRLLHRTTRRVTVTPEGAAYYERVVQLLAELSDIESTARQSLARPSGKIRVEAAVAIATQLIVPSLPDFYAAYPDVDLELGISNHVRDLIADGIDCALRTGQVVEQSLIARHIGDFHFIACATPDYLAMHGTPRHPDDLAEGHDIVGMLHPGTGRAMPMVFDDGDRRVEIAPRQRLVLDDTNAFLAAGLSGVGLIHAPSFAVRTALKSGLLVHVLQAWRSPPMPVFVVYPPNRFRSAKVRVFIDWMVALLEREAGLGSHGRRDH